MENINTLKSLKEKDKKKNNDDNHQAFYTGGSRHSGQQVLGPPKATDDIIKDLFKSALEAGAQPSENEDGVIDDKPTEAFPGHGCRLDSAPCQSDNLKPESSSSKKPTIRRLKLWRNGFSIDDGKLRSYDEPENLEFIASVKKGEIPQELINETRGKETIDISISDYSQKDYEEPKKNIDAFSGEGNRLGNVTPDFSCNRPVSPNSEKANEENAIKTLDTDSSKPTTKIQVRLSDGSKLIVVLNLTHTIHHLRLYIVNSRPNYAALPFTLSTSFPPKELTDECQTIEEAKLQGAVILQKIKK